MKNTQKKRDTFNVDLHQRSVEMSSNHQIYGTTDVAYEDVTQCDQRHLVLVPRSLGIGTNNIQTSVSREGKEEIEGGTDLCDIHLNTSMGQSGSSNYSNASSKGTVVAWNNLLLTLNVPSSEEVSTDDGF